MSPHTMIAASPLPAVPTPLAPNTSTGPAAASAGPAGETAPGGFARQLDAAREKPSPAARAQDTPGEADKPLRPRAGRAGPLRLPATTAAPEASGPAPWGAPARAEVVETVASDRQESVPLAAESPLPQPTDTAALLANLAALTRPQPPTPDSRGTGPAAIPHDGAGEAPARASGDLPLPLPMSAQGESPAPKSADTATQAAVAAPASALRAGTPAAGANIERPPGADAAPDATGRSFAAELQALLPPAAPVTVAGAGAGLQPATPATATADSARPDMPPGTPSHIAASPGSAAFAPELGATLATFVRGGVQHARLELHPAAMGPLTVQIQLDGQAAQIHLSAQHVDTRTALEQAMPQLAGSLREAGLTLSGGGVFEQPHQPPAQDRPAPGGARNPRGQDDGDAPGAQALPGALPPLRRRGVVDLVA